jgi:hypothetical protein
MKEEELLCGKTYTYIDCTAASAGEYGVSVKSLLELPSSYYPLNKNRGVAKRSRKTGKNALTH